MLVSQLLLSLLGSFARADEDVPVYDGMLTYNDVMEETGGLGYPVTYDSRSFIINEQRTILNGGTIHYPRVAPDEWDRVLKQLRDDGLNHVDMYIFWNLHEPTKPEFDETGKLSHNYDFTPGTRTDFIGFIKLAAKNNLFVNLRIGPYVCAEWAYGGMPYWLNSIDGLTIRDDNELWKLHMSEFVTKIVDMVKAESLLAGQGGPIVLAQIENEYWNAYPSGLRYINWVGEFSASLDLEIPFVMCNGLSAKTTVNACNGEGWTCNYVYRGAHAVFFDHQPLAWTENEGWFQNWDGSFATFDDDKPAEIMSSDVAVWFMTGGSHHNFYMWYGGNHLGSYGSAAMTNHYANGANLKSDGQPNEPKKSHLQRLNWVLARYGGDLLAVSRHDIKKIRTDLKNKVSVYRFSDRLAFIHRQKYNMGSASVSIEFEGIEYSDILKHSVRIVNPSTGEVYFDTRGVDMSEQITEEMPVSALDVTSGTWFTAVEPMTSGFHAEVHPLAKEQTDITGLQTDYLVYKTTFTVKNQPRWSKQSYLEISTHDAQSFTVFLDDQEKSVGGWFNYHKGDKARTATIYLGELETGRQYALTILSSSLGMECFTNFGMEASLTPAGMKGIAGSKTREGSVKINGVELQRNRRWMHVAGLTGEADSESLEWSPLSLQLLSSVEGFGNLEGAGTIPRWYKTYFQYSFPITEETWPASLMLDIGDVFTPELKAGKMDNHANLIESLKSARGHLYLNGKDIGRFMTVENPKKAGTMSQRFYLLPSDILKEGVNELMFFVETGRLLNGIAPQANPRLVIRHTRDVAETLLTH